ncbi:hypothetical protein HH214_06365 [Mucilaginibacter robiniae]|uniref:peptidylprolyl isomerase n=1 Tax=Mucilaginibacter robiniae TaxID=2728022 RepID=A0A7L5DXN3_9SPHI|nr:FKBP-type peptidyl-prolyl cis-trans isomerase [Mucilaginibacter robiniae]QJD95521.1 hypothetical protein HH214_06365 [Mucilaginibacter robiniae]
MKQLYTALFLLGTLCLYSCRKDKTDISLKAYDEQQIQAYIKSNGLTNMKRDPTGGDTTGIYYEILSQGTGATLKYSDDISFVYTIKSLDGKYTVSDTVLNHSYSYVGTLTPSGLQLAMYNLVKNKGTRAHLLIPSHLAYGSSGSGTGSSRLQGNESLDYYVNVINDQTAYDDLTVQKYMSANSLVGFTQVIDPATNKPDGVYYKVSQAGTGVDAITSNSTVYLQYSGFLLNGTMFDQYNDQGTNATNTGEAVNLFNLTGLFPKGWILPLTKVTAGAKLTIVMPSRMAFGTSTASGSEAATVTVPVNSCLRYDMNVVSVTNY